MVAARLLVACILAVVVVGSVRAADVSLLEYEAPVLLRLDVEGRIVPAFESRWLTGRNGVVWALTRARVVRLERSADVQTGNAAGLRIAAGYALPPDLDFHALSISAGSPRVVWLVDQAHQRLWKLNADAPPQQALLGEVVGSSVALDDGTLMVNTPAHPIAAFAVIGENGTIVRRFGARRAPPVTGLDKIANTWVLAARPDRSVIAAHVYEPLVRTYGSDGQLLKEVTIASGTVSRLLTSQREFAARVKVDAARCCVEAEQVRFAAEVVPRPDGRYVVRLAGFHVLEEFDSSGALVATHVLLTGPPAASRKLGTVFVDAGVVEMTEKGVLLSRPASFSGTIGGRILGGNSAPADDASVTIRTSTGGVLVVEAGSDGRFRIKGVRPTAVVRVTASAADHLPLHRNGVLAEVLANPFVLQRIPSQCVTARDATTGDPLTRFQLALARRSESSTAASVESGPTVEIADADGRGCVSAPWPPPWEIRIEAEGYASYEAAVETAEPHDAGLAPEALLSVKVKNRQGAPIEGAEVELARGEDAQRTFTVSRADQRQPTNAEGVAAFRRLKQEAVRVTVTHPRYLRRAIVVEVGPGANEADAELEEGGRAEVEVVAGGAAPVEGAVVTVDPLGRMLSAPIGCTTAADGRCVLATLPSGRVAVNVAAPGYAQARRQFDSSGGTTATVRVELRTAVTLYGRVTGIERYGDASFRAVLIPTGSPVQQVDVTGGVFRANDVPAGTLSISVEHIRTRATLLYERVEIPHVPRHDVTLHLPAPVIVRGRVTRDGAGCTDCSVAFARIGAEATRGGADAIVQSDGRYEARLPTAGRYVTTIEERSTRTRVIDVVEVTTDLTRDFEIGGSTVEGRVVDGERKPVRGATVAITRDGAPVAEAITNERGVAHFASVAAGLYTITATSSDGAATLRVDVLSGRPTTVEITLPRRSVARLRVIGAGGVPVPLINARVIAGRHRATYLRVTPDAEGVFTIGLFDEPRYSLVLQVPGYGVKTLLDLSRVVAELPVVMLPRKSFEVEVANSLRPCLFDLRTTTGQPVALSLDSDPGPTPLVVRKALFNSNEAGSYIARLTTCDGKAYESQVVLIPGGPVPIVSFGY